MNLPRVIFALLALFCVQQLVLIIHQYDEPNDATSMLKQIHYFQEVDAQSLSVEQAQQTFTSEQSSLASSPFLAFGIGSRPTWLKLLIENPTNEHLHQRLTAALTWVDKLDIYQFAGPQLLSQWHDGDEQPKSTNFVPGVGFIYDIPLHPGENIMYIRAQSHDPMVLPIQLTSFSQATEQSILLTLANGVLYGILLALISYNLMLFRTFSQPRFLYYSIYIGSFMLLNLSYNGYAFALIYPNYPLTQNYFTLCLMVLHGCCGIVFIQSFLGLKHSMPITYKSLLAYSGVALAASILLTLTQQHVYAALFAFVFLSFTCVVMLVLSALHYKRVADSELLVVAVTSSTLGMLITALSVWGKIPFTLRGFHGAEFGLLIEALLLAILLAKQLRVKEGQRTRAEYLSAFDPLTDLRNRRSFLEAANRHLSIANRKQRPISLILLDIDLFKRLNDSYGHHIGDQALVHFAQLLKANAREGDVLSRWGGEEMILLLPETTGLQAIAFAERLRNTIEHSPFAMEQALLQITASFGVAEYEHNTSFEHLFEEADHHLYAAKQGGRNRVEPQPMHPRELRA